jgi:hypothetical protein
MRRLAARRPFVFPASLIFLALCSIHLIAREQTNHAAALFPRRQTIRCRGHRGQASKLSGIGGG